MENILVDPIRILLMMSGKAPPVPLGQIDCDDLTTFLLGLAFFWDIGAEIVTVAVDPSRPDQFSHVYVRLVHESGTRVPYDLTSGPLPGTEPWQVLRRRVWPVSVPINPSDHPESDRTTARIVSVMVEKGHASAAHPEFHSFMRHIARWLIPALAGMVSREEWRRSEAGQKFLQSVGASETWGDSALRDLTEKDLQVLKAWITRCRTELESGDVDVRKLAESAPKISIGDSTHAPTLEWIRSLIDSMVAALENLPLPPSGR